MVGRSDVDIHLRTSRERKSRHMLDEADGVTGTGCRSVQVEECLLLFMIRRLSQQTRSIPSAIATFWHPQPKEWADIIFTEDMAKQEISLKLRDQPLRGIYRLGSSCDHLPFSSRAFEAMQRKETMYVCPSSRK